MPLRGNIFGISRNVHQKFANFSVAPSRPRNRGDRLPAPLFSSAIFFRKVQKSRQFILGFKGEILILAKMELPFRFLEPPPPGRAKNPDFTRIKTRLTKFPHYLFDFSLGPGPRTFLPIKKHFFFTAACGSWIWYRETRTVFGNPNLFQTAPIALRGGMLKSGESWGRGESRKFH